MLRGFIEFPEVFARSVSPFVEVVGGLVALAFVCVVISGLLALRMPRPVAIR
jgi:hypothetical protein